jgi:hypothetical protein
MKKLIFFIATCLYIAAAFGQEPVAQWGAPSTFDKKYGEFDKIIGTSDKGTFILRKAQSDVLHKLIYLERIDNNGKLLYTKEITPQWDNNFTLSFRDVQMVNGKICMFSTSWIKKEGKNHAYVQEVSSDGVVLPEIKELDNLNSDKMLNTGEFYFAVSPDQSKLLLLREEMYTKEGNEKITFKVFDGSFKELWSKAEELPFETSHYGRNIPFVDNNGNAYLCKKVKVKFNYDYYAVSDGPAPAKLGRYKIDLGEKIYSYEVNGAFDVNNNFVVAGLYDESSNEARSNGWFYYRVDAAKGLLAHSKTVFSPDFLGNYMPKSQAEKGKSVEGFKLKTILPKPDGSVLMLLERYSETKEVKVSGNEKKITTQEDYNFTYNFTDIGVFCIKNDGTLAWNTIVKKEQKTKVDGGTFSSFASAVVNNDLVIVYSNATVLYEKHGIITQEVVLFGPDHYYDVTMVKLGDNGQVTTMLMPNIFKGTMFKMNLAPVMYTFNKNNELILFSENLVKTRYAFGKMKL